MSHNQMVDLALYRLERAEETLIAAKRELEAQDYRTANNRAYYAIFHAIRALLALDGVDFKKHSGVIAYFNQHYIKESVFPTEFSDIVGNASEIRNDSDYDDFYICSQAQSIELVDSAVLFINSIRAYIEDKI